MREGGREMREGGLLIIEQIEVVTNSPALSTEVLANVKMCDVLIHPHSCHIRHQTTINTTL